MKRPKEMQILIDKLTESNVPFEVAPHFFIKDAEIVFYPSYENRICDAVCFYGSYGFEQGLLEIMGLVKIDDEVEGYLTGEEVFNRMYRHYKRNKAKL